MVDRVFTLAVWDVAAGRWSAFVTSTESARVEAVLDQLVCLVPVFAEVVEVAGGDDESIVAALGLLPSPGRAMVALAYREVADYVGVAAEHVGEAAVLFGRRLH